MILFFRHSRGLLHHWLHHTKIQRDNLPTPTTVQTLEPPASHEQEKPHRCPSATCITNRNNLYSHRPDQHGRSWQRQRPPQMGRGGFGWVQPRLLHPRLNACSTRSPLASPSTPQKLSKSPEPSDWRVSLSTPNGKAPIPALATTEFLMERRWLQIDWFCYHHFWKEWVCEVVCFGDGTYTWKVAKTAI